jgi:hypothetical protein
MERHPMSESKPAFRNLRTGQFVGVRPVFRSGPGMNGLTILPDVPGDLNLQEWMPGVIGPDDKFRPTNPSVSYILKFPPETTAELDELIKETGGDATELFKRAIALYKLAKEAVHDGKAVGVASSPDRLETQFTGL